MVGAWAVGVAAIIGVIVGMLWVAHALGQHKQRQVESYRIARQLFRRRREWLEARFVTLASRSHAGQGFFWSDCDFADEVSFARDRNSGQLRALVGVTVFFEPSTERGSDRNRAVGHGQSVLAATAVFRFVNGQWESDGRAIFNLDPGETIRRFGHELEAVEW